MCVLHVQAISAADLIFVNWIIIVAEVFYVVACAKTGGKHMEATLRKERINFMAGDDYGYTMADIEALPEGQRAELLDGELFMMATPTATHQAILMWLSVEVYTKIRDKGGKCKVFAAPFAVYLMNDEKNYVEPDILVICEKEKLDNKGCHGAPDWAVEIVSPTSKKMDFYRKLDAYKLAGVREYWIIDPVKKAIVVYNLEEESIPEIYHFSDTVKSGILEDFEIDFSGLADYDYGEIN